MGMPLVDPRVERYALEHTTVRSAQMEELEREARAALPSPQMLSGRVVGWLLEMLVASLRAELVLEIGTYAGYSALAMAGGLAPGGRLITCEISEEYAAWARERIARSPHGERVEVRVGAALDTVAQLGGPFDFVFIDADKLGYRDYFEAVLPKLSPHGMIALDNTLRDGSVLEPQAADESAVAIARLNGELAEDPRVSAVLLTVRDGVTLVRRRR
ncbi:MAG: class I SAM-dependent methyltransferase [Solirubrobacterales bacterium]|nr:class I SAM-dependent methyltransferase [Solirubrobacterales bacterium]